MNREEVEIKEERGREEREREGMSIACLNLFFPTSLSLSRLQDEHTNSFD